MTGHWVIVCGPSGAGKDSVISWASEALASHPRVRFARRLVTRAAPSAWDETMPTVAFQELAAAGGLAWRWQAHGLHYGVHGRYASEVAAGRVVVVNGSREHALSLASDPAVRCVLVSAPPALLEARLRARGREGAASVAERLARNAALAGPQPDHVIVNDGALGHAGTALRDYLLGLAE